MPDTAGSCSRCDQAQCRGCHIGGPDHPWLFDELQRAADEYAQMPDYAKPIKTDPDALIAGAHDAV